MAFLLACSRIIDRISNAAGHVAAVLVLVATFICAAGASARYGLNMASNAWLEAQSVLFGAVVFLGAAQVLKLNEHIRIDIVYGGRSERTRLLIDCAGLVCFLLPVAAVMLWMTWHLFATSYATGEVSSNAGGLPSWPAKATIPLGFALLGLQGLSELVKRIAALQGRMSLDTSYEKPQQ
jgi:TRAP-type mannitol/chloroaromatic compound transport system permease small subunit